MKQITFIFAKTALLSLLALPTFAKVQKVELVQEFTPKLTNGTGDLYIPLPQKNVNYQKVLTQEITGNATTVKTERQSIDKNKDNDIEVLHLHWEKVEKPIAKLIQTIEKPIL
ncbi:MAG: hypothetical protein V4736_01800 [Bdellovibrionota bacterium]